MNPEQSQCNICQNLQISFKQGIWKCNRQSNGDFFLRTSIDRLHHVAIVRSYLLSTEMHVIVTFAAKRKRLMEASSGAYLRPNEAFVINQSRSIS